MRHRVYGRHLGRDKDQRISLFKSLVRSLIISEKIETTEAKVKSIKGLVDRLVNQAKSSTSVRLISQFLSDKDAQQKLISDIAPRYTDRVSGYTSTMRVGKRAGDGASIIRMTFVDNGKKVSAKSEKKIQAKEEPKTEDKAAVVETKVAKKAAKKSTKEVKK